MNPAQPWSEQAIFESYWDDGLLDLLAGLALLIAGLGWLTPLGALAVLQAPLWSVLWIPLRRQLVEPRAGYVAFSLQRRERNTLKLTASLVLGVACLALVILFAWWSQRVGQGGPGWAEPVAGLPAIIVAAGAIVTAFLTGARRFLIYAVLLILFAVVAARAGLNPGLPIAGGGLVAAICGAWLLVRFIRSSREFEETA